MYWNNILLKNNKVLLGILLAFCCCISHAEECQYWDDLDESSKSEIINSIDVDKNIIKLYLHEIELSDDDMSATILDTLCSSADGNKRMLYFYILSENIKTADGAIAEMLGIYCVKYVNENTDYALEYFSRHQDVANNYAYRIASELYLSDTSFTEYEQLLYHSAKSKCAKEYSLIFLKEIECILAKIDTSGMDETCLYAGQDIRNITHATPDESDEPYELVDVMPEFPGGQEALLKYIEIGYPSNFEGCAQGRVVIRFVVEKDGSVTNIKVERSLCEELDNEAIKHTQNMPRWTPGKLGGKTVRTYYNIPYTFRVR